MNKKIKPKWYFDKPSEKQIKAIGNMTRVLRDKENKYKTVDIPKTKGECSELINSLKEIITNNISISGYASPHHGAFCPCRDCEIEPDEDGVIDDPFAGCEPEFD
jgi:hypothetical protein